MTTSDKNTSQFMEELRAQVEARDAAQNAKLASIMAQKPAPKARKIEPQPEWLVTSATATKKSGSILSTSPGKATRKRAPKTQKP